MVQVHDSGQIMVQLKKNGFAACTLALLSFFVAFSPIRVARAL
jgi:hypothetical protein